MRDKNVWCTRMTQHLRSFSQMLSTTHRFDFFSKAAHCDIRFIQCAPTKIMLDCLWCDLLDLNGFLGTRPTLPVCDNSWRCLLITSLHPWSDIGWIDWILVGCWSDIGRMLVGIGWGSAVGCCSAPVCRVCVCMWWLSLCLSLFLSVYLSVSLCLSTLFSGRSCFNRYSLHCPRSTLTLASPLLLLDALRSLWMVFAVVLFV